MGEVILVSKDLVKRLAAKGLLRIPEPPEPKGFSPAILEAAQAVRKGAVIPSLVDTAKPAPMRGARRMCRHCGRKVGHTAKRPHQRTAPR